MKKKLFCTVLVMMLILSACSAKPKSETAVRVGGLKGPTSMGLLFMKENSANYEFTMATSADELLPMLIKDELDIALVPTNVASVLYAKTEGNIAVIDINTLGVLSIVTASDDIKSVSDLKGQTIYMTGKGTTPEYSLRYVLEQNGLSDSDVTLEFKSEPTEVASVLASDEKAIGLLPQPFVTAACMQNDKLKTVIDLSDEWSSMVTGVTVVSKTFLNENPEAVKQFIEDHMESASAINDNPEHGATLAVEASIVAKEPIALKAIPKCNIVCIAGSEMKDMVSEYLNVLYAKDQSSVGGALPDEEFYFIEN